MAFNGPTNTEVQGDAINNVHGLQYNIHNVYHPTTDEQILQDLARRAAMNATHDSDPVSVLNCHPGTRVRTLETLHEWISERRSKTRVQWVHGSAGVGKSAIAQKTAEDHRGRLVGAFFFSRNDPTRDKLDAFVATMAYQCCTSPHLRKVVGPLIIDAIRSDPNVFNTPAKVQFRKLLLEPFSETKRSWWRSDVTPDLLVVDGIDECIDHLSQQQLIEMVDYAVSFRTPTPFIFLLCSRPEIQISRYIENAGFTSSLKRIEISGTTVRFTGELTESDLDIQKYFLEKFAEIRRHYPVLRDQNETWPSKDDVANLVRRASGQFIFAVTVIKFVDTDDVDYRPQDRLKTILSTEPGIGIEASPYPALDLLYQQILSTCRHWDKVHLILRLLIAPEDEPNEILVYGRHSTVLWHSLPVVTQLLQLRPGDVEMVLLRLRSVIYFPKAEDTRSVIRILHASFTEFLTDRARSGDFFVLQYSREEYKSLVAMLLLRTISSYTAYYPPYYYYSSGQQPSDTVIATWQAKTQFITNPSTLGWYASTYWTIYCYRVRNPSATLLTQLNEFRPECALALALTVARGVSDVSSFIFRDWNACLAWANSNSRAKALQTFIRSLTPLLDPWSGEFYMGFSKDCQRHDAIREILRAELAYAALLRHCGSVLSYSLKGVWQYYQKWWIEEHPVDHRVFPLVLLAQHDQVLLENWVVVRVTPANGCALHVRYNVLDSFHGIDEKPEALFDNDVIHDTSKSVKRNIVKEEDLVAFKARVYELRDLLADLAVPPPDPPKKTRLKSIRGWFRR